MKKTNSIPEDINRKIDKFSKKKITVQKNNIENKIKEQPKKNLYDIWGTPVESNTSKNFQRKENNKLTGYTEVPAIMKPVSGESYNPSIESHNQMLNNLVNWDEMQTNGAQLPYMVKEMKNKNKNTDIKGRTKKETKALEELAIKNKIKETKNMEYNYGKFLKEAKKEQKDQDEKIEWRRKDEIEKKRRLKNGEIFPISRKIGKTKYKPWIKEFQPIEEMKSHLKDTQAYSAELMRDAYDNVFRTGKIETPRTGKNKQQKHTHYKSHNIYEGSFKERQLKFQTQIQPVNKNKNYNINNSNIEF